MDASASPCPRIAILGLFGECNAFRKPIPRADYRWMAYHEGSSLLAAIADPDAFLGPEVRAFFARMDETGPWTPIPVLLAESESGPPLEEAHLQDLIWRMHEGLKAAGPLDGVFVNGHGSVVAEVTKDVDAVMLRAIRDVVGPMTPIVEVLDPHGKITPGMVELADLLISYRTDPHTDMADRGAEAADAMRRLLAGDRISAAYVRLPMMIPTVAIVAPGAPFRPAVERGVAALGGAIANVSILPGYPWTDTPFAGFHVLVSTWGEAAPGAALALELAEFIWTRRAGFVVEPLPIDQFKAEVKALSGDPLKSPICFADIADNPGGGATANTTYALEALLEAGAQDAVIGPLFDPHLAACAHALGVGPAFVAEFNVGEEDVFAKRFTSLATVKALASGVIHPRSGPAKGMPLDLELSAALQIQGVTVVVTSRRLQALAVEQFEVVGVDLAAARLVVVKSRGHYQAAFAEFFPIAQMVAIDTPGWCTPHLERLPYQHIPRPLYPMDRETVWSPELTVVKHA